MHDEEKQPIPTYKKLEPAIVMHFSFKTYNWSNPLIISFWLTDHLVVAALLT